MANECERSRGSVWGCAWSIMDAWICLIRELYVINFSRKVCKILAGNKKTGYYISVGQNFCHVLPTLLPIRYVWSKYFTYWQSSIFKWAQNNVSSQKMKQECSVMLWMKYIRRNDTKKKQHQKLFVLPGIRTHTRSIHSFFFIRNLTTGDDLKSFFTFRQFLIKKVSYRFLICKKNKKYWAKIGQIS
jgi:hypothetical protein